MKKSFLIALIVCFVLTTGVSAAPATTASNQLWEAEGTPNKIVVISDLHLGVSDKIAETVKNRAYLVDFLMRIQQTKDVRELVIAGDLLDEWFLPLSYPAYSDSQAFYMSVIKNNQVVFDELNKVADAGIKTVYVPGNHDMLLASSTLKNALPKITFAGADGLGAYITGDRNEIAVEHGSRYDMFSAPDTLDNTDLTGGKGSLPPGYFYARIAASWVLQGKPPVNKMIPELPAAPSQADTDQFGAYLYSTFWNSTLSRFTNIERFEDKAINIKVAGFNGKFSAADLYPVKQSDGKISAPTLFKNFQTTWDERQKLNSVRVHIPFIEGATAAVKGDTTFFNKQIALQYANQNIDIAVFGHTHNPLVQNFTNGIAILNDGAWIDNNTSAPDMLSRTFAVITTGKQDKYSLYAYETNGQITDVTKKLTLTTDKVTDSSKTVTNTSTYTVGQFPFGNAIDSDGNVWVANYGNGIPGTNVGNSNVLKLSPSGKVIGTYIAGVVPIGLAIDKSGNVWAENYGNGTPGTALGQSNVTKLSPSGRVIGTYATGSYPAGGIAIDKDGNVLITNWGAKSGTAGIPGTAPGQSNVTKLSPSGEFLASYIAGSSPGGIAIDSQGNIWVANKGSGKVGLGLTDSNVTKLSPSGETLGTYIAGSHPEGLAIDPDGNVWIVNKGDGTQGTGSGQSNVTKLSSSGKLIGTYVAGSLPEIIAIDSAGHVWVTNGYNRGIKTGPENSSVTELDSSGNIIHNYVTGNQPYSIAIDKSGNVWVTNFGNGTVGTNVTECNLQVYIGAAKGPQYFPYSGPQWP